MSIIEPHHTRGDLDIHCDVVVVGSGAGGATVAAILAESGLDVVVLEEGAYFGTRDYSANVPEMLSKLMRGGASTVTLGKSPVPYLEGRCVGGTTVVNGGMCWRTPDRILDEWVETRGLDELAPKRMEAHFDAVENVVDARYQDPGSDGGCNEMFRKGAETLGWALKRNKRNQVHCVGSNECVSGCPSGAKRSTLTTWLPRFFKAGGRLYTHAQVQRVKTTSGRASGLSGTLRDPFRQRRFEVRAKTVVLSCGATQTPLLLLRNGLCKPCKRVGKHFTIHPNVKMAARFDDPVDSMRGTHQAWQCTEFVEEGILLAPGAIPLPFMTTIFPGFGEALAERMVDHRYVATGGVLVDDHAEGQISLLPFGIPFIKYSVTPADQKAFVVAAGRLAELYFAAGAREVYTAFHDYPVIESMDDIRKMESRPPKIADTEYFTAHLMGTCRMHADRRGGVVGPDGQTWDVPGLYIADASVLPGTVGVNPQLTIMAMARMIAIGLAERLGSRPKEV